MYVCICNALTERQIKEAAVASRACVSTVYACLGARTKCGKCVPHARSILQGQVGTGDTPIIDAPAA